MGKILDKVLGRPDSGRGRPDGSTLGLSTPATWRGNTVSGPSGKRATQFSTVDSQGRRYGVNAVRDSDYTTAQSTKKKSAGGWKPTGGFKPAGSTGWKSGERGAGLNAGTRGPVGVSKATNSGTTRSSTPAGRAQQAARTKNDVGPSRTSTSKSSTKKAAGGLIGNSTMKKRMNMGGLPSQANKAAKAGANMSTKSGPSWKPAKPATGNYGAVVSAAAKARNAARRAARAAPGAPPTTTTMPTPGAPPTTTTMPTPGAPPTNTNMPTPAGSGSPSGPTYQNFIGQTGTSAGMTSNASFGEPILATRSSAVRAAPVSTSRGRFKAGGAVKAGGPSWKPDKPATGNYGAAVSAAAHARNAARKAGMGKPVKPMKAMSAGGMVKANGCAKRGKTKGRMY